VEIWKSLSNPSPALATIRFLGADKVAGGILTSNEFLKNFGPVTKNNEKRPPSQRKAEANI
jgi:hypothetical protein